MGKVIVVTSGKGGVGKTTSTAALGAALAQRKGEKVVVVDFDVGLRNLDLVMGAERRVVYDLVNVIQGDAKLSQALIRDKRLDTLFLLPASQTRDKDNLTAEGVEHVMNDLKTQFRLDHLRQPGRHRTRRHSRHAPCRHRDRRHKPGSLLGSRLPTASSVCWTPRRSRPSAASGWTSTCFLTRYDPARAERGDMLKVDDVLEILSIPLLGIVPESIDVLRASNIGSPVTLADSRSAPAIALISTRLAGSLVRNCRSQSPAKSAASSAKSLDGGQHESVSSFFPTSVGTGGTRALQVLLAHERATVGDSDLVAKLRDEILRAIAKHMQIDDEKVKVTMERGHRSPRWSSTSKFLSTQKKRRLNPSRQATVSHLPMTGWETVIRASIQVSFSGAGQ